MYKASLKLPKIHKNLALSFNLIIDNGEPGKFANQTVKEFDYEGNTYFTVNGRPYVTLDISTSEDKKAGWSTYRTVNLNSRGLFDFKRSLARMIKNFQVVKDLFYTDTIGRHVLNTRRAESVVETIRVSNKTIKLVPAMVPDEQNEEVQYEGCILYINTVEYYTYLSYNEMEYLYSIIKGIDMNLLQLHLLSTIKIFGGSIADAISGMDDGETREMGSPSSNTFVTIEKNTIPNI